MKYEIEKLKDQKVWKSRINYYICDAIYSTDHFISRLFFQKSP